MYIFESFKSKHVSSNITINNVERQASNLEKIFATRKIHRLASRLFSNTYSYKSIRKW